MRTATTILACMALLVACKSDYQGTSVGNPGKLSLSVADGTGVSLRSAEVGTLDVALDDCIGGTVTERIAPADLMGVPELPLPESGLCGVTVHFVDPLHVEADGDDGGSVDLTLQPMPLYFFADSLEPDVHRWVELGTPGWLDAGELGLPAAGDVVIGPGDPLYDSLLEHIELESAMYVDDGDGALSADERSTGGTGGRPI